jgi:hypothetical protein
MTSSSSVIQMGSGGSPALPRGRLTFGVDATASREATWTVARALQADMFRAAAPIGQLDLQLIFFGGEQCRASKWTSSGEQLAQWMGGVECESGMTQIERVLRHVLREHAKAPMQAVTFIGDSMEEELDVLSGLAGQLGAAGVPIFMFLEGNDPVARRAFRMIALRSGGAFYEFNVNSKQAISRLSEQLGAVARLAVGDNSGVLAIAGKKKE